MLLRRRLSAEQGEQIDSMNLLLYMAPVVLLSLVPTTIILEPGALISMRELSQQHQCESAPPVTPDPDSEPLSQISPCFPVRFLSLNSILCVSQCSTPLTPSQPVHLPEGLVPGIP